MRAVRKQRGGKGPQVHQPNQGAKPVWLRLSDDVIRRIDVVAAREYRSRTGQIEWILAQWLAAESSPAAGKEAQQ